MEVARRRQRVDDSPRVSSNWHTASPSRPPTCNLYIEKDGRSLVLAFGSDGAGASFLAHVIEGESDQTFRKDRVGRIGLHFDSGLGIRAGSTEELERLMEHDNFEEPEDMPEPFGSWCRQIKSGDGLRMKDASGEEFVPKEKKKREKREASERPVKKEKPTGFVGVPELVAHFKKEGGEIRAALRKHVPKPDIGWLWTPTELEAVKAAIKSKLG